MVQTKIINIPIKDPHFHWYNYRKSRELWWAKPTVLTHAFNIDTGTWLNGPLCKQFRCGNPLFSFFISDPLDTVCSSQQLGTSFGVEISWPWSKFCLAFSPGQLWGRCRKQWLWPGEQRGCYAEPCFFRRLPSPSHVGDIARTRGMNHLQHQTFTSTIA